MTFEKNMLCVASLIILGLLSIFSAKYRGLAKEALDCVFRRVTLRPCNTGFDTKIKATILSKLIDKSPVLAKFFNQKYELISWLFVGLFFVSLFWSGRSVYLWWTTGNCNGLNQGGFCVLNPTGTGNEVSGTGIECRTGGDPTGNLSLNKVNLDSFVTDKGSDKEVVFIGCYSCPYTKKTYPLMKKLIDKYQPTVTWVFYPTHKESEPLLTYDYCVRESAVDKYHLWMDKLYSQPEGFTFDEDSTLQIIESIGLNKEQILQCVNDPQTKLETRKQIYEMDKTGIYGTPTIFLNKVPVVGPKPERVYRKLLNQTWF